MTCYELYYSPVSRSSSSLFVNIVKPCHKWTAMIVNHENNSHLLFFVRHPLPGFELGSPTTNLECNKYNALDYSAMDQS